MLYDDFMAIEVDVLDAEFETLLQSQSRAVEQRHHDPRRVGQLGEDHTHFVNTEHHRHVHRAVCMRHVIDRSRVDMKHLAVQEQQRTERPESEPVGGELSVVPANMPERTRHCGASARPTSVMSSGLSQGTKTRVAFNRSTPREIWTHPPKPSHADHAAIGV